MRQVLQSEPFNAELEPEILDIFGPVTPDALVLPSEVQVTMVSEEA